MPPNYPFDPKPELLEQTDGAEGGGTDEEAYAKKDRELGFKGRQSLHKVCTMVIWVCTAIALMVTGIYLFHILAPPNWRWLPPEDVDGIKTFATTITAAVIVSSGVSRLFERFGRL